MEKSEPTLVPEWLKNGGSLNSSGLISDDQTSSTLVRNRSSVNGNGHDFGRSSSSDRGASSYFRRSSSSNGSGRLRLHNSFGKQHERDSEKDAYDSRGRDKSILEDHWRRDILDASGNTLSSKSDNGFRRSHSKISGKHADTWHKKVITNSSINSGTNANGYTTKGSPISGVKKTFLERDFPSLGAEDRASIPEVGRVPSPGLSSAIQNLPIGSSTIANGEKWTSALAEVPVLVGNNGIGISSAQQAAPSSSTSVALGTMPSLNMAEAVAQAPNHSQATLSVSVGTQRLEELAIRQSRQLIPVMPSMPKASALNSPDKQKNKPGVPLRGDVSKASNVGKLHVLKPVREKNGNTPPVKDNSRLTGGTKPASSKLAAPSISNSAATRIPPNNGITSRKPVLTVLEKKPTSQAQSRNEFFNSVRKKSMENSSMADSPTTNSSSVPDGASATSPSSVKLAEMGCEHGPWTSEDGDTLSGVRGDSISNGDAHDEEKLISNGHKQGSDPIFSEEEEAAFLRSLGWEENADEGGLTEEEISAFFKDVPKYINSRIGGMSAGLSSSNEC